MKHILIVDDNKTNLAMAKQELSELYQVTPVLSGAQALQFLEKRQTDLILLDKNMPEMDGRETMHRIKKNPVWAKIPIIFLTADNSPEAECQLLSEGADDFIAKPFVPQVMKSRISRILELNSLRNDLEVRLEEKTREVESVSINSIMAIATTIEAKDRYTSGHSNRVANCSVEIAKNLGWDEEKCRNLYHVALLHDIGKIGVPDLVLNKPARLNKEEYALIKKHPVTGGEILKNIRSIPDVHLGALYHHEHYDGSGYPLGLKGEQIPLIARIIAVADSYDAMTSNRAYRDNLNTEAVIEEFKRCRGTQFDPQIADIFINMLENGFKIKNETVVEATGDINKAIRKAMDEYISGVSAESKRDILTGLYNRRGIEAAVNDFIATRKRGVLFVLDLDNFKSINDNYGHIAGDMVLKEIANILINNTEKTDIVCRIGGDEFVIFFTRTLDKQEAADCAQSIISDVNKMLNEHNYTSSSVSIGIALAPDSGANFEELFSNADKSLYHVKRNGKNSFSFFSDSKLPKDETAADIDNIYAILEGNVSFEKGCYNVDYSEFEKIYCYIARFASRSEKDIQILLFTLSDTHDGYIVDNSVLDMAMKVLQSAVISSLRRADVGTKYSGNQYVILLVGTDTENGRSVAERVIECFYTTSPDIGVSLTYDIKKLSAPSEEPEE